MSNTIFAVLTAPIIPPAPVVTKPSSQTTAGYPEIITGNLKITRFRFGYL